MKHHFDLLAIAAVMAVTCAVAPTKLAAQEQQTVKSDVLIRVSGPMSVGPTDTIGTLWVIGNDATVLGTVRELVVINGTARIQGKVEGNMVLINGTGDLGPSASIGKDLLLYRSTVTRGAGAQIGGAVHNELGVSFGARALWLLWLSVTLAMIVAGLVFGYFAGKPLQGIADTLRTSRRGTLITTLVIVIGLPAAAVISFMTGIGLVLGLFILFVMIPLLSLVGYLITGTALGRVLLGVRRGDESRMYTTIALGLLVLQVIAAIPVLGGFAVIVSSFVGAGALIYRTWVRGHRAEVPSGLIVQPA